jgi:hypothetical protein
MPDTKPPTLEALCVAYLSAQGKTQMEISHLLGLSQSAVSRLYGDVREDYIKTVFCKEKVSEKILQAILSRTSSHSLQDGLNKLAGMHGHQGPLVHTIFLPDGPDKKPDFGMFAPRAALVVYELIQQVRKTVGVAWGSTLWQTTQHLRTVVEAPFRKDLPIDFIPLCGDPLVDSLVAKRYADRTSSRIASDLSKIVNGDEPHSVWLGLVPAFIPRAFKPAERKVIDRFIDLGPHYGRIFGPRDGSKPRERPLADDLDMILTAAGSSKYPLGFGQGRLFQLGENEAQVLREHIYGDIGGVMVPKPDHNTKDSLAGEKLFKELTGLWTGLRLEHLKNCARQAFADRGEQGRRPGVTLLGYRDDLVDVVCEAVKQGLVNHLIISSTLESAIAADLVAKGIVPPTDGK